MSVTQQVDRIKQYGAQTQEDADFCNGLAQGTVELLEQEKSYFRPSINTRSDADIHAWFAAYRRVSK